MHKMIVVKQFTCRINLQKEFNRNIPIMPSEMDFEAIKCESKHVCCVFVNIAIIIGERVAFLRLIRVCVDSDCVAITCKKYFIQSVVDWLFHNR